MKEKSDKSVSPLLANGIILNLLDLGYNWETITKYSGVYPEEVKSYSGRISAEKHYKLLALMHKDNKGLNWILNQTGFSLDTYLNKEDILDIFAENSTNFALLCLNCRSLRHALDCYVKYRDVVGNVDSITESYENKEYVFCYNHEFPEFNLQFVSVINFIFIICIVNHYSNSDVKYKVKLNGEKNKIIATILTYWNCDVEWGSDKSYVIFQHDDMDCDYKLFNEAIYNILFKRVKEEYEAILPADDLKDHVSAIIIEMIKNDAVEFKSSKALEAICSRLNMSKTTLARRLKEKGTTYKIIEKEVKIMESVKLLNSTDYSIGQISHILGFATQSAFNRFFSDSMSLTPLKFRKESLKN